MKPIIYKDTNLLIKTIGDFKPKYPIRIGKKYREITEKVLLLDKNLILMDIYKIL